MASAARSRRFWFLNTLALLLLVALLVAAWSAYQQLAVRARLSAALALGQQAAALVGKHYEQTQHLPDTVEELGFVLSSAAPVSAMELDFRMGILTLFLQGAGLDGQQLLLVPTANAQDQLSWACLGVGVAERYMPPLCRPAQPAVPVIVE